ncbi:sigma 54-interacting transcriptional regulator [candidate division KSB1 bacterium]|nr:sigma 54-interacting transcriptional regulator [candidate division KSB1 bacterium]
MSTDKENKALLKARDWYPTLLEINQTISRSKNLNQALEATLVELYNKNIILSGLIFLVSEEEELLRATAGVGNRTNLNQVVYKIGEGLDGRVAESGKTIIVPRISKEPLFLNYAKCSGGNRNQESSYIGIPISTEFRTLGVLSVLIAYHPRQNFQSLTIFLQLIASTLAQTIRLHQMLDQERRRLLDENVMLKHKLQQEFSFHNIIGNSHEMREVYEKVSQVARAHTTVLLRGESGTGKELIAQAIHYNSLRAEEPFIRVNCAAIPENLIESEFFGYEKGAFTGAVSRKKGRFDIADGGTLFLDEVSELTPMTQVKLLRVLQEQEFERVGGLNTIRVDVRIIAATNANLEDLIARGSFREDLYYRLNVFSIFLPPLRERKSDILLLADHFMLKYGRLHGKAVKRISTPAIDMLMRYHWPGNVRELENCIERAILLCEDQVVHSYHLPPTLQTAESSDTLLRWSLDEAVASYEKELIQDALKSSRGNRARAARLLATTNRILGYKIQKYDIDVQRFRRG